MTNALISCHLQLGTPAAFHSVFALYLHKAFCFDWRFLERRHTSGHLLFLSRVIRFPW